MRRFASGVRNVAVSWPAARHDRARNPHTTIGSPRRDDPDVQFLRGIRLEDGREFQQLMRAFSRSMTVIALSAALAVACPALVTGEKFSVRVNPFWDGAPGGNLVGVTKTDGTILGQPPRVIAGREG
jgi:hypothetical protein